VAAERKKSFEDIMAGASLGLIGIVTDTSVLSVKDREGKTIIREDITGLKESWKRPLGDLI
jgi:hypothetical protein